MRIVNINEINSDEKQSLVNRFGSNFVSVMVDTVIPIVNEVRDKGDEAVRYYCKKYDGAELESLTAGDDEINIGYSNTDQKVINAFEKAIENIRDFHSHQIKDGFDYTRRDEGRFGQIYHPVDSAAVYVPGGKAAYPSSVLMGIIPAQIAGVKDITLITPVKKDNKLNDAVCAVCSILGIKSIIKAGGAQGIAAAGFGTQTIRKSQIIVGPGNIFVTAAKSYLFSLGVVQIDSMAGPSETLIIADDKSHPKWVAYDILSQAEHEENAKTVLIGVSKAHVEKICDEIRKNLDEGTGRSDIKRISIAKNFTAIIASSIEEAIEFSNQYAPEHMQMMVEKSELYLPKIRNVGSLFLGYHSPVAAGDYISGTNHVLPTGGACRFSSGLSTETFYRRMTYQMISENGLRKYCIPLSIMAEIEGFGDMHGGSVRVRFE